MNSGATDPYCGGGGRRITLLYNISNVFVLVAAERKSAGADDENTKRVCLETSRVPLAISPRTSYVCVCVCVRATSVFVRYYVFVTCVRMCVYVCVCAVCACVLCVRVCVRAGVYRSGDRKRDVILGRSNRIRV